MKSRIIKRRQRESGKERNVKDYFLRGYKGENYRKDKKVELKWKTQGTLRFISSVQGNKTRCASQYCEENILNISFLPAIKDILRFLGQKLLLRSVFIFFLHPTTEVLASAFLLLPILSPSS